MVWDMLLVVYFLPLPLPILLMDSGVAGNLW